MANHSSRPPTACPSDARGRALRVLGRLEMLPVECVVRGYITGSGWKDYQSTGAVSGVELPAGLRESERLPEPIFTPTTKAEEGHDEAIDFERDGRARGPAGWRERLRDARSRSTRPSPPTRGSAA